MTYANYADFVELTTKENGWVYYKNEDMLCRVWHVMTDGEKEMIPKPEIIILDTETLHGKVLEVTENPDHTTLHTKMYATADLP